MSAVFSIAKSLWSTGPAPPPEEPVIPSTEINSALLLNDPQRTILSITLSPPSPDTGKSQLAALTDNLGRVTVLDVDQGQIIRVFKGMRDGQVAWMRQFYKCSEGESATRPILLLVIYSPRGILEIFAMRHGPRILALSTERDLKLLQVTRGMLGGSYWKMSDEQSDQSSTCFLLSNAGEMQKICVSPEMLKEYV